MNRKKMNCRNNFIHNCAAISCTIVKTKSIFVLNKSNRYEKEKHTQSHLFTYHPLRIQ